MRYHRGGLFANQQHALNVQYLNGPRAYAATRTRTRHSDNPVLVTAENSVFLGLEAIASTSSLGRGRAGTLESCRAAEVGKYMGPAVVVRGNRREGSWDVRVARAGQGWEGVA